MLTYMHIHVHASECGILYIQRMVVNIKGIFPTLVVFLYQGCCLLHYVNHVNPSSLPLDEACC